MVSAWQVLAVLIVLRAGGSPAPSAPVGQSGMQMQMPMAGGQTMTMPQNPLGIDETRDGSGTSWLPDESPMAGPMRPHGAWMLMAHGNAFLQWIDTTGPRGEHQLGSVNWIMGMAERPLAGGQLVLRGMFSLEPLTVGRCGFPDLLQSGETCHGLPNHDQQHPHNLFMELAATYRRALSPDVAVEIYGGPVGDPALGPTAFPHRLSAMDSPDAPISHHWMDSTHISFGVATGGLYGRRWKAEASVFNGREPGENRYAFDFGAFDSYSGRLWWLPTAAWAMQVSAGHLTQAEVTPSGTRDDVNRLTASATYHRLVNNRLWATTVAWGQNQEAGLTSRAWLAEMSADLTVHNALFARGEVVDKTAADLALPVASDDLYAVSKIEVGYIRWVAEGRGLKTGVGGSVGLGIVPTSLAAAYGGRTAWEFTTFLTVRPH